MGSMSVHNNHSALRAIRKTRPVSEIRDAIIRGLAGGQPDPWANVLVTDQNEAGGYLVPTELLQPTSLTRGTWGKAREHVNVVELPAPDVAVPVVKGGLRARNISGNQASRSTTLDSQLSLGSATITAESFSIVASATLELILSGVSFEELLFEEARQAFLQVEDHLVFHTAGMPDLFTSTRGLCEVLASAEHVGSVVTAAAGQTTPATVAAKSLRDMAAKLPVRAWAGARWFAHPKVIADLAFRLTGKEHDSGDADESWPIYEPMRTLLGFPVTPIAAMPSAPAAGEIALILGDVRRACILGVRGVNEIRMIAEGQGAEVGARELIGFMAAGVGFVDVGDDSDAGAVVGLKLAES